MYYHVWFKTKERKWLLQGEVDGAVKRALHDVADRHSIRLLECETMVDHVHLLVEAPGRTELSKAVHLLKGASARRVLQSIPDIRMDAGISHFWQKRYGAKPVERAALAATRSYIRTQKERPEKYAR
ncbi:MAG TPA: IS200/IS605 family transposase [Dehalococcoidia bacterium]|nr:IS200/IS605 family transposase [Dehalococcoidia bacterium]